MFYVVTIAMYFFLVCLETNLPFKSFKFMLKTILKRFIVVECFEKQVESLTNF